MNTTLKALAAAAVLACASSAQADIIFVDNFDLPTDAAVTVTDTSNDGMAEWQAAPGTTLTAPNLATVRRIGAELTSKPLSGSNMLVSAGGPDGSFVAQASTGATGKALIKWSIPQFTLASLVGNSYFFSVIVSTTNADPTQVSFNFKGTGSNSGNDFVLNDIFGESAFNPAGPKLPFALNTEQSTFLAGGGDLELTFTGTQGFSFVVDQFAIEVPEPSSLALAGLALLGAGFAASRRKTK